MIISANSKTTPQADWENPAVEHSVEVVMFATLNVCVPYVPRSTVNVVPKSSDVTLPALALAIKLTSGSCDTAY